MTGALLSATLGCSADAGDGATAVVEEKLIYGPDDRLEYGQVIGTEFQRLANSTATLVGAADVTCAGANCSLTTVPWTVDPKSPGTNRLCNGVRFRGQPSLGYCTGVLVGPKLIATAGHCTTANTCANTKYVFDFNADASGANAPTSIPTSSVYTCTSISTIYPSEDWALVTLDRPVPRPIMNVRYNGGPAVNTPISMLGYPYGIPNKISPTGAATNVTGSISILHNIDSFAGNSGSPVFNAETSVIEGLHVTPPASHFVLSSDASGACVTERTCPTTGCPGFSGATRVTRFSASVPLAPVLIGSALTAMSG
jgi:V8-like Glu-specific endopeptidase